MEWQSPLLPISINPFVDEIHFHMCCYAVTYAHKYLCPDPHLCGWQGWGNTVHPQPVCVLTTATQSPAWKRSVSLRWAGLTLTLTLTLAFWPVLSPLKSPGAQTPFGTLALQHPGQLPPWVPAQTRVWGRGWTRVRCILHQTGQLWWTMHTHTLKQADTPNMPAETHSHHTDRQHPSPLPQTASINTAVSGIRRSWVLLDFNSPHFHITTTHNTVHKNACLLVEDSEHMSRRFETVL